MKIEQQILERYIKLHTKNANSVIEILEVNEIAEFLETIPSELAALLLGQMERNKAAKCLEKISVKFAGTLIEQLPASNSVILLRLIDNKLRDNLLNQIPEKVSQNLQSVLKYPVSMVGAYINPNVFTIYEEQTIKAALEEIKKSKPQLQSHIYVLNRGQQLVGFIELEKLITSNENKFFHDSMDPNPTKILATINMNSLIDNTTSIESFTELPVVDSNGVFLGILSAEVLKSINSKSKTSYNDLYKTGSALGELYKIGLTSLISNMSGITKK